MGRLAGIGMRVALLLIAVYLEAIGCLAEAKIELLSQDYIVR